MFRTVTFLTLTSQLHYTTSDLRTCVPNTQFFLNGLICSCDGKGHWNEASCLRVSRRQNCQPGKVIWQGCSQCVCQENGQFICNIVSCPDSADSIVSTTRGDGFRSIGDWCTPFRIYYVDCSICVCPGSGRTNNVHCAKDTRCTTLRTPSTANLLTSINKNRCLPNVMYLFSCLHCLCSDEGFFTSDNCVETCHPKTKKSNVRACEPKSFYKKDCNICFCPDNMLPDDKHCTQEICNGANSYKVLNDLRAVQYKCTPYQFTPPRCFYCDCSPDGTVNKQACLELYCLKNDNVEFKVIKTTCNPGEMVAVCTECFCLRNGSTHYEYCTIGCSYRSKLYTLEKVFKNNKNDQLLDINVLERNTILQTCKPNTIYADKGKFCFCPENGTIDQKSCIMAMKKNYNFQNPASELTFKEIKIHINYNTTCEPSTFVQFDCNTCFCSKNATIDPKWCTYDDCEAKKLIQNSQKLGLVKKEKPHKCTPGTVYNLECNYCICPEIGQEKEIACTNVHCTEEHKVVVSERFDCEPLAYYEVDCNICFCPRDGKKNVAKCTKNICEKNFLRTDTCIPGGLFSDECNVCVCPPNGNKSEQVCTKHKCHESAMAWKSIYKLSHGILDNHVSQVTTRKLNLCFPGEEFSIGCYLCVCPEMGLKSYATCTNMLCDETNNAQGEIINDTTNSDTRANMDKASEAMITMVASHSGRKAVFPNETDSAEEQECTPGSMYIIRCKQCICPYYGNVNNFCRALDRDLYCEKSSSDSMRRRQAAEVHPNYKGKNAGITNATSKSRHHTHYKCDKPGKVMDRCFICECVEDSKIIRENCFKNEIAECNGKEPTFLKDIKLDVL